MYETDDILRFLFVTDTHLGYKERDPVRCNDSFDVFEEILIIANSFKVDCIIHGGDLFDQHKPSRTTYYKALLLLRKYCISDTPEYKHSFRVLNQKTRSQIFKLGKGHFESPGVTCKMPIIAIHGNHDDPGEEALLCSADLLEASNLLTYIGWSEDLDNVNLKPLLLEKGSTKVALYGLGNIRDERLHRAFQSDKIKFYSPEFGTHDNYFNIAMLHQNRFKGQFRGAPNKNCIHEQMLPEFLDLVLWGHEHDCIVTTTKSLQANFHIIQPGSSVATALTHGEALRKHVVLIELRCGSFRSTFIPLRTVRPLELEEVTLNEEEHKTQCATEQGINQLLIKKVDRLIQQSQEHWLTHLDLWKKELVEKIVPELGLPLKNLNDLFQWTETRSVLNLSSPTDVPLSLIGLKVEFSGFEHPNSQKFASQFVNLVANPTDLVTFYKKKKITDLAGFPQTKAGVVPELEFKTDDARNIQELVFQYIEKDPKATTLELLAENELNAAVMSYVQKSEASAIQRHVDSRLSEIVKLVKDMKLEQALVLPSSPDKLKKTVSQAVEKINTTKKRSDSLSTQNNVDNLATDNNSCPDEDMLYTKDDDYKYLFESTQQEPQKQKAEATAQVSKRKGTRYGKTKDPTTTKSRTVRSKKNSTSNIEEQVPLAQRARSRQQKSPAVTTSLIIAHMKKSKPPILASSFESGDSVKRSEATAESLLAVSDSSDEDLEEKALVSKKIKMDPGVSKKPSSIVVSEKLSEECNGKISQSVGDESFEDLLTNLDLYCFDVS